MGTRENNFKREQVILLSQPEEINERYLAQIESRVCSRSISGTLLKAGSRRDRANDGAPAPSRAKSSSLKCPFISQSA